MNAHAIFYNRRVTTLTTNLATNPRPLLVRFGAMGDMVLLTVMIRALHERCGAPVDLVASGSWTIPLLQGQPGVGEIFLIGSRRRPYWLSPEQRALVHRLRSRGSGPVWVCESDDAKPRMFLRRAGYDNSLIALSNDHARMAGEHFTDRWLRFASATPAGWTAPSPTPAGVGAFSQLEVDPRVAAEIPRWLAKFSSSTHAPILIQAGNKRTMRRGSRQRASNTKYWPENRWAQVLQGLRSRHPEHPFFLLGVPNEAQLNDDILGLANVMDAHNVARDLSIPMLLALARRSMGLISVDSGPAHAAAAIGCPVVTLFGKAEPALYLPRGPKPWSIALTGVVEGEPSIDGISSDMVLSAWNEIMVRAGRS
jgi:ADP-heptose:LPS heptosyltransferase